jgi:hypothetical protein
MRQPSNGRNRAETRALFAATLACYLMAMACMLAMTYSLAALARPGLLNARMALAAEARP